LGKVTWIRANWLAGTLAAGLAVLFVTGARAADPATDQLWLISTRQAPWSHPAGHEGQLQYWRWDAEGRWADADLDAFLETADPGVPTCVFIHGNRTNARRAVRMGRDVYGRLAGQADARVRFVIWSWPAGRIQGGSLRDIRLKARRSDVEGYYLAWWVDQIGRDVKLSLIGYSFGARVIAGALHILAGGQLAGRTLPEPPDDTERTPVRAVLVAAAMDNDWLLPGRRNELALSQIDRLLVAHNRRDPIMRWYPLMYCLGGPKALGYAGPACPARLGPERERIELLGLDCSVGRNHDLPAYLNAPGLRRRLPWFAFLDSPTPDAATDSQPRSHAEAPTQDRPGDES
jgi:hypothetical protein